MITNVVVFKNQNFGLMFRIKQAKKPSQIKAPAVYKDHHMPAVDEGSIMIEGMKLTLTVEQKRAQH